MIIVGLETSTQRQSVALVRDGVLVAQIESDRQGGQSRELAAAFATLLEKNATTIASLDLLVVGAGPGSFTGLRIGLAFARGIGLALSIPVELRCSLRAVATLPTSSAGFTAVALDARRGEVYSAIYRNGGAVCEALAPAARSPADFALELRGICDAPVELRGDGFARYAEAFAALLPGASRTDTAAYPTAAAIALECAWSATGEQRDASAELSYLRAADAELTTKSPRWLLPAR